MCRHQFAWDVAKRGLKLSSIAVISFGLIGCESKAGTGALIGAGGGAAAGGLIGSMSHGRAGEGALIGGAVGALGGALIGHSMDENDRKQAQVYDHEREYDRRHTNAVATADRLSREDVIRWTSQGVRDDIIIDRIDRSGTVFHLTAADQNDLRDEGVSEPVIRAMKDTAKR